MRSRTRGLAAIALTGALVLTACGGDDDATDDPTDATTAEPTAAATETGAAGEATTVTAVNYAYPDAPAEVAAGTTIVLQNDSEDEVHEIIALRINDDETRPLEELLQLPPEEQETLVTFTGVALAPPGASSAALPAPPLTLTEPGRYLFACFIPTGAPPDEVMAAVQAFIEAGAPEDGEPEYPDTGPPHVAQGMAAEVTVT
jgi:plastocyanin